MAIIDPYTPILAWPSSTLKSPSTTRCATTSSSPGSLPSCRFVSRAITMADAAASTMAKRVKPMPMALLLAYRLSPLRPRAWALSCETFTKLSMDLERASYSAWDFPVSRAKASSTLPSCRSPNTSLEISRYFFRSRSISITHCLALPEIQRSPI